MVISKNCKICSEIKFEIENVEHLRRKLCENFELKILSDFKLNIKYLAGWMDGWVGGWKVGKAGSRIAYSNQLLFW